MLASLFTRPAVLWSCSPDLPSFRPQGYRRCREFLVTQRPLPSTVRDFWTMVWDQGVQTIVSLPHGDHSTVSFPTENHSY